MFPDKTTSAATNYCRNPTGDPTGAWCYVGGAAETDSCDVPGCPDDGDDSETLLAGGGGGVHWMYLLPEWRNAPGLRTRLKLWAPGVHGGVSLRFRRAAAPPSSYDLLRVGADRGEKIRLSRVRDGAENGSAAGELAYPYLLTASRWTELAFEFADDSDSTVTMSSAADGQIFRWGAVDGDGGRVAFVGLSAGPDDGGFVGARFPAEGTPVRVVIGRGEGTDLKGVYTGEHDVSACTACSEHGRGRSSRKQHSARTLNKKNNE